MRNRSRLEEMLPGGEAKWRALAQHSPDHIMLLDKDANILFINHTVPELTREQVIGTPVYDYVPEKFRRRMKKCFARVLETGEHDSYEVEYHTSEGKVRGFEARVGPVVDLGRVVGFTVCSADLTERKQMEDKLREGEEKLRLLVANVPTVTWISDREGSTSYISPNVEVIYGFTSEEIYRAGDELWLGRIHPDDASRVKNAFESLFSGGKFDVQYRIRRKDEEWMWIHDKALVTFQRDGVMLAYGAFTDITERQEIEQALRESEEVSRYLAESAFEALVLHDGVTLIRANRQFSKVFGYEGIAEMGVLRIESFVAPESRELVSKLMVSSSEASYEATLLRKDGTKFPAEIQGRQFEYRGRSVRVTAIRDLTERYQAEEALRSSERRYQELFNSVTEGIGIIDAKQTILFCNPAYARILGEETPEDAVGKSMLDYVPVSQMDKVLAEIEKRKRGQSSSYGLDIVTAEGRRKSLIVSVSPRVDEDARFIGSFVAIQDVTDMRQLQEFAERAHRLEAAGRIAGQVAHDFNNLLGPLVAYPDFIREELPKDHPVLPLVKDMETAAQQMAEINQQLLTLARRGHHKHEPLNVNDVVSQVLENTDCVPNTVSVETDLCSELMNTRGGASQIYRVISNLIDNAVDAMENGGRLRVRTENYYADKVCQKCGRIPEGEYVKFTISDNGSGIARELQGEIFDPFFTTKRADKKRGSGLGLSVVDAVMRDHDGFIDFTSWIGRGTSFYLYFPITRDALDSSVDVRIEGGNERVLVIDDDEVQREVMLKLLTQLGYVASATESGEQAMELLRERPQDLLLIDMVMPAGIDGTETYRRALELNPSQRAIVVSGFSETRRVQEARRLGAGAYLRKPLSLRVLAPALRKELERITA